MPLRAGHPVLGPCGSARGRTHTLGDVVTALATAGLRIEFVYEHPYTLRARWPFLERSADGTYGMPEGRPELPLLYSLRATRPAQA